jgi:toxin ParE1/3/4
LDKYAVKLLPKAYRDIDRIYGYISEMFKAPETASSIIDTLENAIIGLEFYPYRGSERKVGMYANRGYRQLFVGNFTILYRIDEKQQNVLVITVKYSPSQF